MYNIFCFDLYHSENDSSTHVCLILYTCHVQAVILNNEQNKVNKFDHRLNTSWKFLYMPSGTGLEVIKLYEQNIKAY